MGQHRFKTHHYTRLCTLVIGLLFALPAFCQSKGDGIDDVLQYLPYASVVALKASGVESRHDWPQLAAVTVGSWVVSAGVAYTLKHTIDEWRPDHSDRRSMPSGHATFAFAGATVLHHEYGHLSPWVSVAGYGVAVITAADRVHRDRHHWYDVCAGAAIGILSTEACYWLSNRIFKPRQQNVQFAILPTGLTVQVGL